MSNQIENRIVEMEFDNKQFEDGVKESLSTLDKLKKALNFKDAGKNLQDFSRASKTFDLNGIGNAIETVGEKFSTFRILGIHALANVVDFAMEAGQKIGKALMGPLEQIKSGGWNRAMNIEQAKFQLEGLGVAWEEISDDIDYGVSQTAYGLDAAAKAAAQLTASGVEFGKTFGPKGNSPMAHALRGISGVAAMTNSTYEDISGIFSKIAGQGRVYAQDLNSLAARGLNAAAILAESFNTSEEELREMVHDGEINFEIFSEAMYEAFGEHAVEANNTFTGALSNIRAALSRTGQPFATSIIHGMIPIFNEIRLFVNALNNKLGGVAKVFESITSLLSDLVSSNISSITAQFTERFTGLDNIANALGNTFEALLRIIGAISQAFSVVFPSNGGFIEFLNAAAEGAERFSEMLILDDDALANLRNTVIVILGVLKGLFIVIGQILKVAGSLVGVIFKILGGLGEAVLFIGNLIYNGVTLVATFVKGLNIGEKLSTIFGKIGEFALYLRDSFSDTSTALGKFVEVLKYVGITIGGILAGPFALIYIGIDYLSTAIQNATNPIDFLKEQFTVLGNKVKEFIAYLKKLPIVGKTVKNLTSIFEKVKNSIGNVKKFFQDLIDKIKNGTGVIDALRDKLGKLNVANLTNKFTGLAGVFNKVKTAALSLGAIIVGTVAKAFIEIKNLIDGISTSKNPFEFFKKKMEELNTRFWEFIDKLRELPIIGKTIKGIEDAFNKVKESIMETVDWFKDFYEQVKEGASFFEVLKTKVTELAEIIKASLTERIDEFLKEHEGLRATFSDIKNWMLNAKDAVVSFANTLKDKLKTINTSKIILAAFAALVLVIVWNINELIRSIGGLARKLSGGFINMFRVMPTKYDKFITGLVAITAAITLVAGAFYLLKDVETDKLKEITRCLATLIGMVAGLSLIATLLVQITTRFGGGEGFTMFSTNMLSLSVGVVILIGALKLLEQLDMNGIWHRVAVLGAILGGLMTVGIIMGRLAPKISIGGLFMVAFAGAVYVLVLALDRLSKVDLTGIQENWKGLTAIIIAFGVFAAAASKIGIGAIIGLIAFLIALRLLFKNFDAIKAELDKHGIGELLNKFFTKLKNEIKSVLTNARNVYRSLSKFDKIMLGIYAIITTGGIVALTSVLSSASKSIRRVVVSVGILLAGIAAFMALFYYIADMATSIPIESIKKAEKVLMAVGGFILLLLAICAIGTDATGLFAVGGSQLGGNSKKNQFAFQRQFTRSSMEKNLAQIKKLILSISGLLLAISAFMFVVGKLSPEEIKQAEKLLIGIMSFVSVMAIVCAFITKTTIITTNFTVGFSTFVGVVGLMAAMIGAFVVLMNYFENFDFANRWKELVAAIIGLGAVVAAVIVFCRMVTKYSGGLGLSAIIGSIGVSLFLIGGIIVLMTKYIKPEEAKHAVKMAAIIINFLAGLIVLAIVLAKTAASFKNIKQLLAQNVLIAIAVFLGEIITLVLALGGLAIAFQKLNINTGKMIIQLGTLVTFVTMLFGLVIVINKIASTGAANVAEVASVQGRIISMMEVIMGLIAAVIIFAGIAYWLKDVHAGNMLLQFATFSAILFALVFIVQVIANVKSSLNGAKLKMAEILSMEIVLAGLIILMGMLSGIAVILTRNKVGMETIGQIALLSAVLAALTGLAFFIGSMASYMTASAAGIGVLTWMVGLLYTMVPLLYLLDNLKADTDNSIKVCFELIGVLTVLGGLAAACISLGSFGTLVSAGVGVLTWMVGLLTIMAAVFKVIDGFGTDSGRLIGIASSMVLVLAELGQIAAMAIMLGQYGVSAAAGVGVLTWMVGLFTIMAIIFKSIDGFKSDAGRLLGIASSISLVLVELGGIAAACIAIGKFGSSSAAGVGLLTWMVGLFTIMAMIFKMIDSFKTSADRLLGISQSMVLVLVELGGIAAGCIALGYFSELIVPGITTLYLMIPLMYALVGIFAIIDHMKSDAGRILGISQIIMLVLVELITIASTLGALIIATVLGSISATALVPLLLIFGTLVLIFSIISCIKTEGLLKKSQIIMLALVELVAIASIMGALILALVLGSISAAALYPLVAIFGILSNIFIIISKLKVDGLLKKSQIVMLTLLELVGIATVLGALVIAMVLSAISATALKPLVSVFRNLVEIFKELQKINADGLDAKANAVLKCLLKLVGIAALLGIIAPLALVAIIGIPSLLGVCEGMVLIATALKKLESADAAKIEKVAEILTNVVFDIVKAGILGAIGGPGLIMIAVSMGILAQACAAAAPGVKLLADAIVELAEMTPEKINYMSIAITQFFKTIAKGLIDLGNGIALAILKIANGVITAINRIYQIEPAFDFLFKMLSTFMEMCVALKWNVLQVMGVAKSLEWLGIAIGIASLGMGTFASAITSLAEVTPDKLDNIRNAIQTFFEEVSKGVITLSGSMNRGLGIIAEGLVKLSEGISNSGALVTAVIGAYLGLVFVIGLLATLAVPLYVFSMAVMNVAIAFGVFALSMKLLSTMASEDVEKAKNALKGFFEAIDESKAQIDSFIATLWKLIAVFAVFSLIVTVFGPGLAGFAAILITVAIGVTMVTFAINELILVFAWMAENGATIAEGLKTIILTTAESIAQGINDIGAFIVQNIIAIGLAISIAINEIVYGIVFSIINAGGLITSTVSELLASVETSIREKISQATVWGSDLINSFVSGIRGGIDSVRQAVAEVANTVYRYLHFSAPDEGPLQNFYTFSPDMMDIYIQGIINKQPGVESAVSGTADIITNTLGSGSNLISNVGDNAKGIIGGLISNLTAKIPQLETVSSYINSLLSFGGGEVKVPTLSKELADQRTKLVNDREKYLKDYKKARINELAGITKVAGKDVGKDFYSNRVAEATKNIQACDDAIAELEGTAKTNAKTMEEWGDAITKGGKGAGGAAQEVKGFAEELAGVLEGQMSIFSKFEEKEAMSKETLLENMRSQIEGMTKWANNMNALAAKGIDQGLYEKLAMMGVDGAQYVAAFNEMTAEELAQANDLWAQSLVLPTAVSNSISASFGGLGTGVVTGFVNGMTKESATAMDYIANFGSDLWWAFHDSKLQFGSPSIAMELFGVDLMIGLKDGIRKYMRLPIDAMVGVCVNIENEAKKGLKPDKFKAIGIAVIDGLTAGLSDEGALGRLLDAVYAIANAILGAMNGPGGVDVNSPSKKTRKTGHSVVEGLVLGMKDHADDVIAASEELANNVIEPMRETIAGIAKNLIEDEDFTPVITPVLDLTNISQGARQLNNLLSANQVMSANSVLENLQNGQLDGTKLGTTFIQNNYSPKALNRIEIYRQTKNQFAQYKEAMQ